MALPISVFIVSLNEVDRIERTIRAVNGLCADIVVVDCGSSDGTQQLASALGARVIHNEWLGYGAQKNLAQNQCQNDWVLNVDADEVVTAELANEIRSLFEDGDPRSDAYSVRIIEVYPGDDKPRPLAYSFNRVRLYRKDKGRFSSSPVHDSVELQSNVKHEQLRSGIHHFSLRDLGQQISKFNSYTDAQVADLNRRMVKISVLRMYLEFPMAFLKAFILRRHFIGGHYGFLVAMNYAIFRHLRVAKYHEARRTMLIGSRK